MVKGRRFVLKHHFQGAPKKEDFDLVEEELPQIKEGEFQFRSVFISVDPYQRPYTTRYTPPFTMMGSSVAVVEKSKNTKYPEGCHVVIYAGWVERGIFSPDGPKDRTLGDPMVIPDIPGISKSLMLGSCGMPGNTAYFGFLEICKPKAGETVVVSGAAGAVGSLVGQIAKIKGCTVIGFAGDDDKVAWLKSIGFDHAFNYKTASVVESLKTAAPKGVDCYFDNVGGDMTYDVISSMNLRGRISVCGAISQYNSEGGYAKVKDILPLCIHKELSFEGFIVARWLDRWMEGVKAMGAWIREGKIQCRETTVEGFENTPEAFQGLFTGRNTGKMIVKL